MGSLINEGFAFDLSCFVVSTCFSSRHVGQMPLQPWSPTTFLKHQGNILFSQFLPVPSRYKCSHLLLSIVHAYCGTAKRKSKCEWAAQISKTPRQSTRKVIDENIVYLFHHLLILSPFNVSLKSLVVVLFVVGRCKASYKSFCNWPYYNNVAAGVWNLRIENPVTHFWNNNNNASDWDLNTV